MYCEDNERGMADKRDFVKSPIEGKWSAFTKCLIRFTEKVIDEYLFGHCLYKWDILVSLFLHVKHKKK